MTGVMTVGKVPDRKPEGREGPPERYPKDSKHYADPLNWKYPVHTPFHARAARRYFDNPLNRAKYTEEEQDYIDWMIDEALLRFGVVEGRSLEDRVVPFEKDLEEMDLEDLLVFFLGKDRLRRAMKIEEVSLSRKEEMIEGKVKNYPLRLDLGDKRIVHSCPDWERRSGGGLFCKHVGAAFLKLSEMEALQILKKLVIERDRWIFQMEPEVG
ncbi:MAG: SWIM zinc finger family protein [Candidatus Thermoplasmatota archaeon]|nr:SWIM zinc finger family protein [Candidatus Thermoplasmatota archaeon]